jgi:hypothetical protein
MNKLLIILFFYSIVNNAQTITQAFNEPSIGDVDKNYRLDTSAYTTGLPSTVTGSNVVWDFTKVTGAFPVIFDSIVAPSAATGGTAHPSATYAQKRSGINAFFKSSSSPSQTEWLGAYSPSLSITFTNSAIIATYPISYGYTSTDPVTGVFKYNTTNGVCNGVITVMADGVGTLNLPGNVSFQNVIRLKSIEQLTMTVNFLSVGSINQSIYSYYVPGKKYPLITQQYQKYQLLAGTPTITAMAYGNFDYFTVAGISNYEPRFEPGVYPNPFNNKLYLRNESTGTMEFMIYNLNGQQMIVADEIENLNTSNLQPGIYILEIKEGANHYYQKIIKE